MALDNTEKKNIIERAFTHPTFEGIKIFIESQYEESHKANNFFRMDIADTLRQEYNVSKEFFWGQDETTILKSNEEKAYMLEEYLFQKEELYQIKNGEYKTKMYSFNDFHNLYNKVKEPINVQNESEIKKEFRRRRNRIYNEKLFLLIESFHAIKLTQIEEMNYESLEKVAESYFLAEEPQFENKQATLIDNNGVEYFTFQIAMEKSAKRRNQFFNKVLDKAWKHNQNSNSNEISYFIDSELRKWRSIKKRGIDTGTNLFNLAQGYINFLTGEKNAEDEDKKPHIGYIEHQQSLLKKVLLKFKDRGFLAKNSEDGVEELYSYFTTEKITRPDRITFDEDANYVTYFLHNIGKYFPEFFKNSLTEKIMDSHKVFYYRNNNKEKLYTYSNYKKLVSQINKGKLKLDEKYQEFIDVTFDEICTLKNKLLVNRENP